MASRSRSSHSRDRAWQPANLMFDIESMPDLLRPCGAGQYSGQAGGARGDETYQLIQATSHDIDGRKGTLSFTASQS